MRGLVLCVALVAAICSVRGFTDVSGPVDDAKCDVEAVEAANSATLYSILSEITNSTSFRLIKVNLGTPCEFFDSAAPQACGTELPPATPFEKPKAACSIEPEQPTFNPFASPSVSDPVDTTTSALEDATHQKAVHPEDCNDSRFWLDMCRNIDTNSSELLNLQLNPERSTGYNGSKVWAAIYKENCLQRAGTEGGLCYEERVLYRLLSAIHTSINTHIALKFFPPSKAANRTEWKPNPQRFFKAYAPHPDRIKNLHFGFVLLLRAVKKMAPTLAHYPFVGSTEADTKYTKLLVNRLLETSILHSCSPVFDAFDETMLFGKHTESAKASPFEQANFQEAQNAKDSLKRQFKGVFQNVSKVLDCVACQKCKLHGKIALMGVGTALKILLVPPQLVPTSFSMEEVVALFNTLAKFSHAIKGVDELFEMARLEQTEAAAAEAVLAERRRRSEGSLDAGQALAIKGLIKEGLREAVGEFGLVGGLELDKTIGAIASLSREGMISKAQEESLVRRALSKEPELLLLGKHFGSSLNSFKNYAFLQAGASADGPVDVAIVGAGLAGLVAAVQLLDAGYTVALFEKEAVVGGNSAWASSGINAVDPATNGTAAQGDSVEQFRADMLKGGANPDLAAVLTSNSHAAVEWLRTRADVSLDQRGQLGGHSFPRTYRPADGLTGSKLVFALKKQLMKFSAPRLKLQYSARVTALLQDSSSRVNGVQWSSKKVEGGAAQQQLARSVVLASGGYASDTAASNSLLKEYRPELLKFATTNGRWAVGDGVRLARSIGAHLVDMHSVQVHPTAFIDPSAPTALTKTLCAEILRGSGAVLLDERGERFVDELQKRDVVSAAMVKRATELAGGEEPKQASFYLVLNQAAATVADKHVTLYTRKGLLQKHNSITELASALGMPLSTLERTLSTYDQVAASGGVDQFGKKHFHNTPFAAGPFYSGLVTPALHYSMGGLGVDSAARVLQQGSGVVIEGLYAAGEVVGGIHGENRLGGNAMTECVVFGIIAASSVKQQLGGTQVLARPEVVQEAPPPAEKFVSAEELAHNNGKNGAALWTAIHGQVYDLTEFAPEHPAGIEPIQKAAGRDATAMFDEVHSLEMLDDFKPVGRFKS